MASEFRRLVDAAARIPRQERLPLALISLLTASVPWTYAHRDPRLCGLVSVFALVSVVAIAALPAASRRRRRGRETDSPWRGLRSMAIDPPVALCGGLLLLLAVQALNAGRTLVFVPARDAWAFTPPPVAWLPSAHAAADALAILNWFVPAWAILVGVRHGLKSRPAWLALWTAVSINGLLLALYGVARLAPETEETMSGMPPPDFSVFGYQNHAGAFFTMMFCLSAGMALHSAPSSRRRGFPASSVLFVVAGVLCVVAAYLSLSRAAIVFCTLAAMAMLALVVGRHYRSMNPPARLNLALAVLACAGIAFFLIGGSNQTWVGREMGGLAVGTVVEHLFTESRWFQIDTAWRMWLDNPLFGVGGGGYRYQVAFYLAPEKWGLLREGTANVHCDPLQFLVEFGIVGFGLMVACALALLRPFASRGWWKRPILLAPMAGIAILIINGAVDLPFRNATIICHCTVMLAVAGRLQQTGSTHASEPPSGRTANVAASRTR